MTLPLPVIRKRFFAPLCVLFFGMAAVLLVVVDPRARARLVVPAGAGTGRELVVPGSDLGSGLGGCRGLGGARGRLGGAVGSGCGVVRRAAPAALLGLG